MTLMREIIVEWQILRDGRQPQMEDAVDTVLDGDFLVAGFVYTKHLTLPGKLLRSFNQPLVSIDE